MLVGLEDDQNAVFSDTSTPGNLSDFSCIKVLARLLKALDRFNSHAALDDESELKLFRRVTKTKPEGEIGSCKGGSDFEELLLCKLFKKIRKYIWVVVKLSFFFSQPLI